MSKQHCHSLPRVVPAVAASPSAARISAGETGFLESLVYPVSSQNVPALVAYS